MSNGFEGIVIGSIEYKEKSKIVELYTPLGRENVLVRGASKITSNSFGFTTTLNYVNYQKTNANFPVMIEYSLNKSYYFVLDSIKKANVVTIIIQVIKSLGDDAPHHRIFPFIIKCLDLLSEKNPEYVLSVFLIKMLAIFGVQPAMKNCVICGRTELVNFSLYVGGAICNSCGAFNKNNLAILEWFKYLYYDKSYVYKEDINYKILLEFIYSYYMMHVHLKLKDYNI